MNILIVVEKIPQGYLEYSLSSQLAKLGHNVCVLTFSKKNLFFKQDVAKGFTIVYLPYLFKISNFYIPKLVNYKLVSAILKDFKPKVIHCQPLYSPLALLVLALPNFYDYKIVGSIMTQLVHVYIPWTLPKKLLFIISKIFFSSFIEKNTSKVFVKTKELGTILSRSYNIPEHKICVIPLGSDPKIFKFDNEKRALIRKKLFISENDLVIINSGKIYPEKGIDLLIRALAPIILKNNSVKLLIIGKGDETFLTYLKKLITGLKISKNVLIEPWVAQDKLPWYYSAADIGVWPGLSSISIVDAASTGLPLIITDCPIETFAVENGNGFTFKIGDETALRNCLQLLISDYELRKEMGRNSRLLVEQKLNWKSIAMQYLDSYNLIKKSK